jgi:hypothetical protein
MAAVSIPHNEPWIVARWAFSRLLERTALFVHSGDDRYVLKQAVALDGLHFDLLEVEQATRIAKSMELAADEIRAELLAGQEVKGRDVEFAEALAVLTMRLHDVHE